MKTSADGTLDISMHLNIEWDRGRASLNPTENGDMGSETLGSAGRGNLFWTEGTAKAFWGDGAGAELRKGPGLGGQKKQGDSSGWG